MSKKHSSLTSSIPEGDKGSEATVASAAFAIRSRYDFSRVPVRLICVDGEDRTQQSFRDECDINVLMKRYEKTGVLPSFGRREPQYLDATAIDFQSSMDRVAEVQGVFSKLDARTRARFENNPELMLEFLADPANDAEAVKLGLKVPEVKPEAPVGGGVEKGEVASPVDKSSEATEVKNAV